MGHDHHLLPGKSVHYCGLTNLLQFCWEMKKKRITIYNYTSWANFTEIWITNLPNEASFVQTLLATKKPHPTLA